MLAKQNKRRGLFELVAEYSLGVDVSAKGA